MSCPTKQCCQQLLSAHREGVLTQLLMMVWLCRILPKDVRIVEAAALEHVGNLLY